MTRKRPRLAYSVDPILSKTISSLRPLERAFFPLVRQIEITNHLFNPVNLREQEEIFWRKFDQGKVYNPQYHYRDFPAGQKKAIGKLKQIMPQLMSETRKLKSNLLTKAFLDIISEENIIVSLLNTERHQTFAQNLKSLYGVPPIDLTGSAKEILSSITSENETGRKAMKSSEFADRVSREFQLRRLDWQVFEEPYMGPRFSVAHTRKEVWIKAGLMFSEEDYNRFVVHEIETHVFRAENGNCQPLEMFEIGLYDYLATEEGLASVMEERNNVLSSNVLKNYAGRVLAASLVDRSFHTIVGNLLEYFDRQDAYEISHRIKRGLEDTGQPGGLTKDYVYLYGRNLVNQYVKTGDPIERLYVGKIALTQVSEIWSLVENGVLERPKLLPSFQ